MKKPAGSCLLEVFIILLVCTAAVGCMMAWLTRNPGFLQKLPEILQILLVISIVSAPTFTLIGLIHRWLHKPRQIPLRPEPLGSLKGDLITWSCILAIINGALVIELALFKLPADSNWVMLTILVDILFVFLTVLFLPGLIQESRNWKMLDQAPGIALATIQRVYMEDETDYIEEGRLETSYSYHTILEFSPKVVARTPVNMVIEALISKSLYNTLKDTPTVNIRYAVKNPRIFLIEGE